jgi:hypothetical protein
MPISSITINRILGGVLLVADTRPETTATPASATNSAEVSRDAHERQERRTPCRSAIANAARLLPFPFPIIGVFFEGIAQSLGVRDSDID